MTFCPFCGSKAIRKGIRKNKHRIIQKYFCKTCKRFFTDQPLLQSSKTYNLKTILNSISNYNLGKPLRKQSIPKSTIHNWIKNINLPMHRLRRQITKNPIKKQRFIHHKQPFLYQYHKLKLQFAKKFPKLINYLRTLNKILPSFENTDRISQISKLKEIPTTLARARRGLPPSGCRVGRRPSEANDVVGISEFKTNTNLIQKQNYTTKLANIALQITNNNKERHNIIENFMLINDTATIATEIPIYLKEQNLTGHIDILQIRYHKIYILDYKPEPFNKDQAITQLLLYRKALCNITKIPEYKLRLAFFNHKAYYELSV